MLLSYYALNILFKIGKKAYMWQVQGASISTLHKEGYSQRKIDIKLHFSKKAVPYAIKNFYGTSCEMGRSRRPKKRSIRDDYMKKCIATRSPKSSRKKIRAALLAKATNVSHMMVSRCLSNDFGQESHKTARKPLQTTAIKLKHLEFTKKYEDCTAEQ